MSALSAQMVLDLLQLYNERISNDRMYRLYPRAAWVNVLPLIELTFRAEASSRRGARGSSNISLNPFCVSLTWGAQQCCSVA